MECSWFTCFVIIIKIKYNNFRLCPLGLNPINGMPTSIQIISSPNCERLLLAAAQDLEGIFKTFKQFFSEGFGGWTSPTTSRSYGRF